MNDFNLIFNNFKKTNIENNSIGLAQLNFNAGDFEYNSKKIASVIIFGEKKNLKLVLFPELSLWGTTINDIIKRHPILVEENKKWLFEIAKFTKNTTAVVGFIDLINNESCSCLAILNNGKISNTINLSLNSEVHNINGTNYLFTQSGNVIDTNRNFDVILDFTSFNSRTYSEYYRDNYLSKLAQKHSKPLINVNRTGAIDGVSYDGSSRSYNSSGEIISRAKSFEEELLIINSSFEGNICKLPQGAECKPKQSFSLDYENDLERTYLSLVQIIRDYFKKNGFERAVIGLSGGLDSTICAVLLVDALGKNNVYGISMPSKITSNESRSDAEQLALNLGMNFSEVAIKTIYETYKNIFTSMFNEIEQKWNCRYSKSFTDDNIQARARAMYLWGISNEFASCTPIATSDKSESYMGYATINGDMSGGFAPIADITKTKLFALARWLNKNRTKKNAIPESIILKRPGAELAIDEKTGKPLCAEDALMPYEFMDEVIWRIENKNESYCDMLNSKFIYEKQNNVSLEEKTAWLDKFFRRMATSAYKWSILPPSATIDSFSISKDEYKIPISSAKINYKGMNSKDICSVIEKHIGNS